MTRTRWLAMAGLVVACSSESKPKPAPASGERAAPDATPLAPLRAEPPSMTAERLIAQGAGAFVDRRRGLALTGPGRETILVCGRELDQTLPRLAAILGAAKAQAADRRAKPMSCAVRDSYVDCDFERTGADPYSDPDSTANFVFRASAAGEPVLVAVLLGTTTGWVKLLDDELAAMKPCDPAED